MCRRSVNLHANKKLKIGNNIIAVIAVIMVRNGKQKLEFERRNKNLWSWLVVMTQIVRY